MYNNAQYFNVINPVIKSAKGSLDMLARASVPEAVSFANLLNENFTSNNSSIKDNQKLLLDCLSSIYELRYKSINYYIKALGFKTVVDLGCGYSPRGLHYLDQDDINYIGVDLPAIINDVKKIAPNINYYAVDITNLRTLKKVFKSIKGSVLIISEGLLHYLTKSELQVLIKNIYDILKEHPGIWITPDFQTADYVSAVLKAAFDESVYEALAQNLKQLQKEKIGTEFGEDLPAVVKYGRQIIEENGFIKRTASYINDEITFSSMNYLNFDIREKIINKYKSFQLDAFYIKENEEVAKQYGKTATDEIVKDLHFRVINEEKSETIVLEGRLDTITSPELLEFCEKYANPIKELIFDCKNLEYISSAGLRVFLIMYKKQKQKIKLINTQPLVTEVLKQTNFYEILC